MKPPLPSPPRAPVDDWSESAVARRVAFFAGIRGGWSAPHLGGEPVPSASARGNVEGLTGFAQVPVGVAYPLVLHGDFDGAYAVPFATTEGTLVASYQRGFRVLAESGGVHVRVLRDGYALFPLLAFGSIDAALAAGRFIDVRPA